MTCMGNEYNLPSIGFIIVLFLLIGLAVPAAWWLVPVSVLMAVLLILGAVFTGSLK